MSIISVFNFSCQDEVFNELQLKNINKYFQEKITGAIIVK